MWKLLISSLLVASCATRWTDTTLVVKGCRLPYGVDLNAEEFEQFVMGCKQRYGWGYCPSIIHVYSKKPWHVTVACARTDRKEPK